MIVSDPTGAKLFRVDIPTVDREIVTSPAVGGGAAFDIIGGIAVGPSEQIVFADNGEARLVSVDSITGDRQVISGAGMGTGPLFAMMGLPVFDPTGNILVPELGLDLLLSVDPNTGNRTIVSSDSVGSGPAFDQPIAVAIVSIPEPSSAILLIIGSIGPVWLLVKRTGCRRPAS